MLLAITAFVFPYTTEGVICGVKSKGTGARKVEAENPPPYVHPHIVHDRDT